jgi:Protein of unknown function (DUF3168)
MGQSALLALRQAIQTQLEGDASLASQIQGVFDYVLESQVFPYIFIGQFTEIPDNTFTEDGRDIVGTLHIWTDQPGDQQGLEILGRVVELLDFSSFTVPGYDLIYCEYLSGVPVRTQDRQDFNNQVRQIMATFHFVLQKA